MSDEREFVGRNGRTVGVVRASSGSFALERRAQDDSKNKQRQEQTTARTNNGKNKQRHEQKQIPPLRYGMTNREQATARTKAKANTEILAAPE
jgi:hypothetical protein